jgi:hypothetical protein
LVLRHDDSVESGARGVNTSVSPISAEAQVVKPARSAPSASGSYQIWFSTS